MVEEASAVPLALHQIILIAARPLHRASARSPSPAARGRMSVSTLAARHRARVHANHHAQEKRPREAERRKAHAIHCPRFRKQVYAVLRRLVCCADARQRGALAFRRFAADSPRQSQPALAQPQAVFPGTRLRRVSSAFACPSPARSAQTGLFAGPTVSRAARERSANPRAGTASRSAFRHASRTRPSDERDSLPRTRNRDECQ